MTERAGSPLPAQIKHAVRPICSPRSVSAKHGCSRTCFFSLFRPYRYITCALECILCYPALSYCIPLHPTEFHRIQQVKEKEIDTPWKTPGGGTPRSDTSAFLQPGPGRSWQAVLWTVCFVRSVLAVPQMIL